MRRNWVAEATVAFNYSDWIKKVEEDRQNKRGNEEPKGFTDDFDIVVGEGITPAKDALLICDIFLQNHPDADVIYGDTDVLSFDTRKDPFFKPDFSPQRLLCQNYITDFCLVKKGLNPDGLSGYELALHLMDNAKCICHIPEILSHKVTESDNTLAKSATHCLGGTDEKNKYLFNHNISGHIEPIPDTDFTRVVYDVIGEPLVSVIIPSKDHPDLVGQVVKGLRENTDYKNIEIILVDNGSGEENKKKVENVLSMGASADSTQYNSFSRTEYIHDVYDFNFSKMCNIGAAAARGEYILLLNDDIEIPKESANWLSIMLGQAGQPGVGAVGAKLYYPGGKLIQHDGVVSIFPGVAHFMGGHDDNDILPNAENRVDKDMIAVTGACLLVKKELYEAVGGFNDKLAVAFNDVDFCFKLLRAGYRNVLRNDVILIHHESISRGDDLKDRKKKKRMFAEREILFRAFPEYEAYDPYRNPLFNQFEPDVSPNYFITESEKFTEIANDYRNGSRLSGIILMGTMKINHQIMFSGTCLFILNDVSPLKVLLIGKSGRKLEISAKRFHRPELREKYFPYPHIEYGSFRAVGQIDEIPEDEYEVFLVRHGKKYKTPCETLVI